MSVRMFGAVREHKCKLMFQSDSGVKIHTCGKITPHWTLVPLLPS